MAALSRLDGDAVASIAGLRPARLGANLRTGLGREYFSKMLGEVDVGDDAVAGWLFRAFDLESD
jgi:hypothetical protein